MGKRIVNNTITDSTNYIAVGVLLLSALMQAVFLCIGKWDYTVLLGNLLGGIVAVLNFFIMGLTVQRAVTEDEATAKKRMQVSHSYRTMLLLLTGLCGGLIPCFHIVATLLPFLFPRVAIAFRPLYEKKHAGKQEKTK